MTGFARGAGNQGDHAWVWEARSVNGRGLDVRVRVPPGYDALEQPARALVTERFRRGNVTVGLQLVRTGAAAEVRVNEEVLERVIAIGRDLARRLQAPPPAVDGLLALRGVVDTVEVAEDEAARTAREAAMLAGLATTLDALAGARGDEGARLAALLGAHLDDMSALVAQARSLSATRPEALRARLSEQVAELRAGAAGMTPERLAQEVALLAVKADVREELGRLDAHVAQARQLLADGKGVGRRFDFLAQEFNREANTLCSKSGDVALTRVGLDLKVAIDQLREQVQNVE